MKLTLQNVFAAFLALACALGFAVSYPWIAGGLALLVGGGVALVLVRGRARSGRDRERATAYAAVMRGQASEIGTEPRWGCAASPGATPGWELRWRRLAAREGFDVNRGGDGVSAPSGEPARLLATMDGPVDEVQLRVPCPAAGRVAWSAKGGQTVDTAAVLARVAPGATQVKADGVQVWALGGTPGGTARANLQRVAADIAGHEGATGAPDERVHRLLTANAPFLAHLVAEGGWLTWRSVESTRTSPEALAALLPELQAVAATLGASG